MISIFMIGLGAAFLHVLSGPDHLAAVTPLVTESKKQHWKVGFSWGIGHVIGMLFIGLFFLYLKDKLLLEEISHYSEILVGFVLIFLGFWMLFKLFLSEYQHNHPHFHFSKNLVIHTHKHSHTDTPEEHNHKHSSTKHPNTRPSLFIGILHGFAGIGHFVLFFPVLGFSEMSERVSYIVGFGLGSILAMTVYALLLGKFGDLLSISKAWSRGLKIFASLLAIIVGLYWITLAF